MTFLNFRVYTHAYSAALIVVLVSRRVLGELHVMFIVVIDIPLAIPLNGVAQRHLYDQQYTPNPHDGTHVHQQAYQGV